MKKILFIFLLILVSDSLLSQVLLLKKPLGGEVWPGYSVQRIEWTSDNIDNVKIESSLDSGRTWTTIIGSYPASAQYYDWEVPSKVSDSCYIRLTDVLNASTSTTNYKNKPFRIPPVSLVLDSLPLSINSKTVVPLTWNASGVRKVNIYVSNDNKVSFKKIADTINATSLYYSWVLPDTLTGSIYVKIENAEQNSLFDIVTAPSNILLLPEPIISKYRGGSFDGNASATNSDKKIIITTPAAVDSVFGNEVYSIHWKHNNLDNVTLQFSGDDGLTWSNIVTNYPATAEHYEWTVPNSPTNKGRIRIYDASDNLTKDSIPYYFIIRNKILKVISPDSSIVAHPGVSLPISWASGGIGYLKVLFLFNNHIGLIKDSVSASTEMINWILPDSLNTGVQIIITDISDSAARDSSSVIPIISMPVPASTKYKGGSYDGFSAASNAKQILQLLSPVATDEIAVSSNVDISWKSSNIEMINIDFSSDSGYTWSRVADHIAASSVVQKWRTPNIISDKCLLKISNSADSLVNDVSKSVFSLLPKMIVNTTDSFNWIIGTPKPVQWIARGVDSVNIYYKLNATENWILIKDSVLAAFETYNWIIPSSVSDSVWLKVEDMSDNTINTVALYTQNIKQLAANFSTTKYHGGSFDGYSQRSNIARIVVQRPVENEVLKSGTLYTIKWTSINLEDSILLQYSIDSGATWTTIAKASANSGQYEWKIPEILSYQGGSGSTLTVKVNGAGMPYKTNGTNNSNKCLIRALDPTSENVLVGISTKPFTITSSQTVPKADISFNSIGDNTFTAGLILKLYASSQTGIQVKFFVSKGNCIVSNDSAFIKEAGPVSIGAFVPAGNGYSNSDTIYRSFCINPIKPVIQKNKDSLLCFGDSVLLMTNSTGNQWYKDGKMIAGADKPSISINSTGNYTDTLNASGCRTGSDIMAIKIMPLPALPVVTLNRNSPVVCANDPLILTSSNSKDNHWYLNGKPLVNDTSNTIFVTGSGKYNVVSGSGGCKTDSSNTIEVTINPLPALPSVQPLTFCKKDSIITLDAVKGNGTSLLWYTDSLAGIGVNNNPKITLDSVRQVRYFVSQKDLNTGCESGRNELLVNILPAPAIPNVTTDKAPIICSNDSLELTSSNNAGNVWYLNDLKLEIESKKTILVNKNGKYKVISSLGDCKSAPSNIVEVVVNQLPESPKVTALDLCQSNSLLTLTAEHMRGYQLKWYVDSLTTTGSQVAPVIQLDLPGKTNYYVTQTDPSTGCESERIKLAVAIGAIPPIPTITRSGDNLISSQAKEYQWYFNNNLLGSANSNTLKIPAKGIYRVKIKNDSTCWINSPDFLVQEDPSSIALDTLNMIVYPNPAQNLFFVQVQTEKRISGFVTLQIVDLNGNLIKTIRKFVFNERLIKISIPIYLKPGIYNVQVIINGYQKKTTQIIGL